MGSASSVAAEERDHGSRLAHAPFALFAQVMGLAGLAIGWRRAVSVFGVPSLVGEALFAFAGLVFVVVLMVHLARAVRFPALPLADFRHPVDANFLPTFSVALVLLAAGIAPYEHAAAQGLWMAAATIHFLLAFAILRRWFTQQREVKSVSPAWFIPVVGNILMPVVGAPLGFGIASWFLFSVGFTFWVILAPIVTHRIFFEEPLPERAVPSLFILLAPPAIGGLAMLALNGGEPSVFSHVMLGFGSFIALMLGSLFWQIVHTHFAIGWWALTFPLAGYASLALAYAAARPEPVFTLVAGVALAAASLVVAMVAARTISALISGRLVEP